ncbi:MAG: 2Fe-2S iron-sulfur cluster-binding protein [bacterium]|nr:2Fe-2S iron-sulfur cluster-binding protein [bacterium]
MAKVTIDGQSIEVSDGITILWAARQLGRNIPTFCYYPWFPPQGNCRICQVEIKGMPKLQIACNIPVRDGMEIFTDNERVLKARRAVMEFLLIHHPLDCPICDQASECDLQDLAHKHGVAVGRYREAKRTFPKVDYGEKIAREMNRCIHCRRCIKLAEDYLGVEYIGALERGDRTEIGAYIDSFLPSDFAGNVIDICPVGALTDKKFRFTARVWDLDQVDAHRPDCEHECKCRLGIYRGEIRRVTSRINKGVMDSIICDDCRYNHYNIEDWVIEV